MSLKSLYYNQCPGRKIDALRRGYYLVAKVSEPKIVNNKQSAYATAYWSPNQNFEECLAVKINLTSLSNRLSEGLKDECYKKLLENKVLHIVSNDLEPAQNPSFKPTYKIVSEVLGPYDGEVNPVEFLTEAIQEKWEICMTYREYEANEAAVYSALSEDEEQALYHYIEDEECTNEENVMFYEADLQEQEKNEINQMFLDPEENDDNL